MDGSDDRDPLEGLEDRLQSHAKAFESLLALTPAQDYYGSQIVDGKDPSEQWNRKKQTKEQKRAAKKAKLDPANQKSALDVMKEREAEAMKKKRKREEGEGEDGESEEGATEPVQAPKRKKGEEDADAAEARRRLKAEKRKEKRQEKKAKVEKKKERTEAKKAAKQDRDLEDAQVEKRKTTKQLEEADEEDDDEDEPDMAEKDADLEDVDFSGLADQPADDVEDVDDAVSEGSSAPSTPAVDSPAFDVSTNHSTASSSSSIIPPEAEEESSKVPSKTKQARPQKPTIDTKAAPSAQQETSKSIDPPSGVSSPKIQLPDIDHEELQARVRKRIEELRAARKADGPEGKPVKSRQDLLEQRRKKGEQRKAAKKAQRQKQKEDEAQRQEAQLRGSGSPLSADIFSPRSPKPQENNYSFSRLAFDDGTSADPTMTSLRDPKKTKDPSDPRTALQAAQKKQARIAGYDPAKRAEIGEKDMWLHARQRAQGERVRDDTSLLKKALKRKEKQKGKSGEQWREREQAVVEGKVKKQKKREANLQKRKDEKGGKGKKGKGVAKGGKTPGKGGKGKGRPGFEGRFKA